MSKRLIILEKSLKKKNEKLDVMYSDYFSMVKEANGQPLNDKRGGHKVLERWEKKKRSIYKFKESIEKTKNAIENEKGKIYDVEKTNENMPQVIQDLVESKVLVQWRKHPTFFFVAGVEKARMVWREKKGLFHRYYSQIPTKEGKDKFSKIYKELSLKLNN